MLQVYEEILGSGGSAGKGAKYSNIKEYLKNTANKESLALIYKTIGEVYREAGDVTKGISASHKALSMFALSSTSPDKDSESESPNSSSPSDQEQTKVKTLLSSLKKQMSMTKEDKLPVTATIADIFHNLALLYLQKQEPTKALYFLLKCYQQKL